MHVNITSLNNCTVLHVHGRIDTITAGDFEAQIMSVLQPGICMVIDCSGLDYISSSGLRVFLVAQKKINADKGQLKLSSLQPAIREIFDISGFSTIFEIHPDTESAAKD